MTFEDKIERGSFTGATSADVVEVSLPGMSGAMVQLGGTFTATATFEVLVDEGTSPTWRAICGSSVTTPTAASTATTAGTYQFNVSGARRFRARCSAFTSGPVTVAVNVSRGSGGTPCPTLASGSTTAVTGGPVIVVGQTAGGGAEVANSVSIGMVGAAGLHRNCTSVNPLSSTNGADILGVGPLAKDAVSANYFPIAGDPSGRQMAVGAIAAGVSTSGINPVLVGGGDAANNLLGLRVVASATDNLSAAVGATVVHAEQAMFNGVGWDKQRNSQDVSLHASAVTGTGTVNTDITTYNYSCLVIHANVTLYNGGTVLFKVQMQDANAVFVDIPLATTGAVAAGADIFLTVGPTAWGANATPVFYANQVLPRTIRIVQTVAGASVTFSAAYCLKN